MSAELQLTVCENFEQEVRQVLETEKFEGVKVTILPARCHNLGVSREAPRAGSSPNVPGEKAVCLPGCELLLKGRADPFNPRQLCQRQTMGLCFELLVGHELLEHLLKDGAYLLTPGWLARWRDYIQHWGFDRNTAREFFAESIPRLVLLDSLVDPNSAKQLEDFAAFVARPFEILPVGVDFLRLVLKNLVRQWQMENQSALAKEACNEAQRKLGDYAMTYDLMGRISSLKSEVQVIAGVFEMFTMLFAPARLIYVPLHGGKPGVVRSVPAALATDQSLIKRLCGLREACAWADSQDGFLLQIGEPDEVVGILEVGKVAFPQYLQHYFNVALSLAKVCGLAIRNSRIYETLDQKVVERSAKLQEAVSELEYFSYTITHDMRAPLRAMRGYSEMLLSQDPDSGLSQKALLERIALSAERMDKLITGALNYSELVRQEMPLAPVDVEALLRGMVEGYPSLQQRKAQILIAEKMPLVLGNEAALTQCCSNLLSNALKFVEPGKIPEIRIWAESREQEPERGDEEPGGGGVQPVVRLWFEDNGIGIEADCREKVFVMFQRLTTSHEGTGIGLALVKKAAERMGGKVGVESEVGKGSRFWLEFKKAPQTT